MIWLAKPCHAAIFCQKKRPNKQLTRWFPFLEVPNNWILKLAS
jgi:hypothetical protein